MERSRSLDLLFCFCFFFQLISTSLSQSSTVVNTCTECSRNPAACRRISGLYTVTVLTEGTYNPVVEIPAPACDINITEFSSSSNYIALRTETGQGIINSYWGLGQPGQYYGAGVRFSYDKASGSCKGTCIHSEGPTTDTLVVQILYYDKNPGIAYSFTLPNSIPFTPFDGTYSKQNSAKDASSSASSSSSSAATTSSPSSSRYHGRNQYHHRRHHHGNQRADTTYDSGVREVEFEGEYYTGSMSSRSEGRPDVTSALNGGISGRHTSTEQHTPHDYTNTRYGSHTLGGRGLSYTSAIDPQNYTSDAYLPQGRDQRDRGTRHRHIVERYRTRPRGVRKLTSPQYVSELSSRTPHSRQSQYQSFTASTSYLDNNRVEEFDGSNRLNNFNSHASVGRGQTIGTSQYRWKISGLTECSKTCGGGVQRTNIVCISVGGRSTVVVTPENCANNLKPRTQTLECNTSPCEPAWEADEWSECSVTCGSGTQTRKVECRQRFSSTFTRGVSADKCGLAEKPAVAQQCEKGLCTTWKTGDWGDCSKQCGGGLRKRRVYCVDTYESQIPSTYCSEPSPSATESCNTESCDSNWWLTDWSTECSESCGQGVRRRSALCMDRQGNVIPDSFCDKSDLPSMQEVCRSDAGCRGTWFAGAWGRCSADCGEGIRSRQILCLHRSVSTLSIARDEECDASVKPASEEKCVNTQCTASWYTSSWSECSVTCGDGYKTRNVRCVDESKRPSRSCVSSLKPDQREVCSLSTCVSNYQYPRTSRKEFSTEYSNNFDGTFSEEAKDDNDDVDEFINAYEEEEEEEEEDDTALVLEDDDFGTTYRSESHCKDKYWNCLMVIQARLCTYSYYQQQCCRSCQKVL